MALFLSGMALFLSGMALFLSGMALSMFPHISEDVIFAAICLIIKNLPVIVLRKMKLFVKIVQAP